jgi:hypothetical protein
MQIRGKRMEKTTLHLEVAPQNVLLPRAQLLNEPLDCYSSTP